MKMVPAIRTEARLRWVAVIVLTITLAVFGLTLLLVSLQLRQQLRAQILSRDGEVLNAVALMRQHAADAAGDLGSLLEDPLEQLVLTLETSRTKDVLALRLFDAGGRFITGLPVTVTDASLPATDLAQLNQRAPVSRYHTDYDLAALFLDMSLVEASPASRVPLLEVLIPMVPHEQSGLSGIAQFFLPGLSIQLQFAELDRSLGRYGLVVFGLGSAVIFLAFAWALGQLQRAHRLLAERSAHLLRANQELSLRAKTSAIGALTAHLLHGLKNPVAGLQHLVSSRRQETGALDEEDWQDMSAATRRMQALIGDLVRILGEENGLSQYELTLAELAELVEVRARPMVQEHDVRFTIEAPSSGSVTNHQANLILVLLQNLIQNAAQATPAGQTVALAIRVAEEALEFEVRDQGPGLPEELRARLFTPCQSSKPGGSGIGLALCKQLADHLGAQLLLRSSGADGSVFVLVLPINAAPAPAAPAAPPPGSAA